MKAIGFANKFYTLWDITEDTRTLGNGRSCIITHYCYIKNISFDKETAFAKYPGVPFNEDLRGKSISWDSTKEVWDNVDTFRFGKYKYEKIDGSDLNYTTWYWCQVNGEHKDYVAEVLKNHGYEIRKYGDGSEYLMSPEALENERKEMAELNEKLAEVKDATELTFIPDHNCDDEGYLRMGNVLYHFPEVKENCYQGFPYYLPVINGKSKRIKNKNVKVTEFTYNVDKFNDLVIDIVKFEIVK